MALGGPALLFAFSLAAVGAGAGRALTTTYLPVLLERIDDAPVADRRGDDRQRGRGLRGPDRGRHLVGPPRPAAAVHRRRRACSPPAASSRSGSATPARTSRSAWPPALAYAGLNALTTAHRTIVADDVDDARRPAATSAQELAGLAGAVVAVAIGGALIEPAPAAAFALAAGRAGG